jgi:glycosyltransferase involved in cell wall biosynthesis
LSHSFHNLRVAGNCPNFAEWFRIAYGERCSLLPNLYLVDRQTSKRWSSDILKIGALGAIRPEKNLMTAAAAAVAIHSHLDVPVELHMSTGGENCHCMTLSAIEQMVAGLPGLKLIRHHWDFWDKFIKLIGRMDLVIQVSYTESFNMVTADAISQRVPAVVSPPIYWAPEQWMADPDDALDVARVGIDLLTQDQKHLGADALLRHDKHSLKYWLAFLRA